MPEFKFPDVGEGITEGEIVRWLVKEGDKVKEHQPIAEIETDKAVVEIPSPYSGTVIKIHHKAGDTVKVGETLVTIGESSERKKPAEKYTSSVVGQLPEAEEVEPQPVKTKSTEKQAPHALATPATRRMAKNLGVNLKDIEGTGAGGRVTEEDIRRHAGSEEAKPIDKHEASAEAKVVKKYDMFGYLEHVPLKGIRKATAKKMTESVRNAAHVTHMDEADVTHLYNIREKEKDKLKGVHLTFLPFIVKAVIAALRKHPYINATLDMEHEEIILKKYYNIGIAVDVGEGLVVPVVKGADNKSIPQIAKEIEELAQKAKERKLDIMDMQGGTFTITSIGSIGGIFATPIINYPEVAILAVGRIREKPAVHKGKIVVRRFMPLSLSFDHRILDGAEAARFMNDLIEHLEDPHMMMVE
ncbi:MAG: 2-oxo acid dehydrogenase subunit E2 [Candidatus Aenigmarchaeota archaeon]|nr:2-oxo acid dehydrogenase subunit E2 [Candidatus Aenigmarchaeota archaeon]